MVVLLLALLALLAPLDANLIINTCLGGGGHVMYLLSLSVLVHEMMVCLV